MVEAVDREAEERGRREMRAFVYEEYEKLLAERGVSQGWLRDAVLRRIEEGR